MSQADDVLQSLCLSYASAVNASDSLTYSKWFAREAIGCRSVQLPAHRRLTVEQVTLGKVADQAQDVEPQAGALAAQLARQGLSNGAVDPAR
ncbi:hypothetical protein [Marinobacter sp. SS21]|uniref:hypothetical protein n=1 Tax=Marinobacter sp. SS21 TaxID=2979460 RepID=UPI00232B2C75|nr:hypothetical protein [Marinobacter sp. SS21]MDC0661040.1 hypothetical protein [Marinobacter sp. SS21]